jgi:hypothetical protein
VKVGSNAHVWTMLFVFGFCVSIALNALSNMLELEGAMSHAINLTIAGMSGWYWRDIYHWIYKKKLEELDAKDEGPH